MQDEKRIVYGLFVFVLALNILLWVDARDVQASWGNVPPVPSREGAIAGGLGDSQYAYRASAIMLQNLGEIGGRTTKFEEYNYADLEKWFYLQDALDSTSNYMPYLAAQYYGASRDPEQLDHVINYLLHVGVREEGLKWRWLMQAAFLAKYGQNDSDKALVVAKKLAEHPKAPGWARRMPAVILMEQGKKDAAYEMLVGLLAGGIEHMDPTEVNYIIDHICNKLLTPEEASADPICGEQDH